MDAYCQFTELFISPPSGRTSRRGKTPITLPALREIIQSVRRPRHVVFEEGRLTDWMFAGKAP